MKPFTLRAHPFLLREMVPHSFERRRRSEMRRARIVAALRVFIPVLVILLAAFAFGALSAIPDEFAK